MHFVGLLRFHGKWMRSSTQLSPYYVKNVEVAWFLHIIRWVWENCIMNCSSYVIHIFIIQATNIYTPSCREIYVVPLDEILRLLLWKRKDIINKYIFRNDVYIYLIYILVLEFDLSFFILRFYWYSCTNNR